MAAVPDMPAHGARLWVAYHQIARGRQYAGMGEPRPLSDREINDWSTGSGQRLAPWEREVIFRLDDAWFEAHREEA